MFAEAGFACITVNENGCTLKTANKVEVNMKEKFAFSLPEGAYRFELNGEAKLAAVKDGHTVEIKTGMRLGPRTIGMLYGGDFIFINATGESTLAIFSH